jgi:TPR repeat protein/gas vesicle protein
MRNLLSDFTWLRRVIFWLVITCAPSCAMAQNCDEGVVRLPDRSGTIVICSAVAAQVPQLSKQLNDAMRTLGNQQTQIAELTRLIRGLNGVSKEIGVGRQAQMLQSLSSELTISQRGGDEKTRRNIQDLNDRFEDLQTRLPSSLNNQTTYAAMNDAIKGAVGDAIAKLELGSASRQLEAISTRLQAIQGNVAEVKEDTTLIKSKLDNVQTTINVVKKETSDDPRKELANRGVAWSNVGFSNALLNADIDTLKLFFSAGWNPLSASATGEGNAIADFIWLSKVLDPSKVENVLKFFKANGLDPNAKVVKFGGSSIETIGVAAAFACNSLAMDVAIKLGTRKEDIIEAVKQRSWIMPATGGIQDCQQQIIRISASLGLKFLFEPNAWPSSSGDQWHLMGSPKAEKLQKEAVEVKARTDRLENCVHRKLDRKVSALTGSTLQTRPPSANLKDGAVALCQHNYRVALRKLLLVTEQEAFKSTAQFLIGRMYRDGNEVPKDAQEMEKWYLLAAKGGDAYAQQELGATFEYRKDYQSALNWYQLAAEQGDDMAQRDLGGMYLLGQGTAVDLKNGARWIRLSADQGRADARNTLGHLYENGVGVAQDYVEAAKWYQLATAQANFAPPKYQLGLLYESGKGVPRDDIEALKWFQMAADLGHEKAIAKIKLRLRK